MPLLPAVSKWDYEHPLVNRLEELEHGGNDAAVAVVCLIVLPQGKEHGELGPVGIAVRDVIRTQPTTG